MTLLTSLPPEILHSIFQWLCPEDLLLLPRVCRRFHRYVKGNWKLCRDVYTRTLVRFCLPSALPLAAMSGCARYVWMLTIAGHTRGRIPGLGS